MSNPVVAHCSFCGRPQSEVAKLISGGAGQVFICDRCIDTSRAIIEVARREKGTAAPLIAVETTRRARIDIDYGRLLECAKLIALEGGHDLGGLPWELNVTLDFLSHDGQRDAWLSFYERKEEAHGS